MTRTIWPEEGSADLCDPENRILRLKTLHENNRLRIATAVRASKGEKTTLRRGEGNAKRRRWDAEKGTRQPERNFSESVSNSRRVFVSVCGLVLLDPCFITRRCTLFFGSNALLWSRDQVDEPTDGDEHAAVVGNGLRKGSYGISVFAKCDAGTVLG